MQAQVSHYLISSICTHWFVIHWESVDIVKKYLWHLLFPSSYLIISQDKNVHRHTTFYKLRRATTLRFISLTISKTLISKMLERTGTLFFNLSHFEQCFSLKLRHPTFYLQLSLDTKWDIYFFWSLCSSIYVTNSFLHMPFLCFLSWWKKVCTPRSTAFGVSELHIDLCCLLLRNVWADHFREGVLKAISEFGGKIPDSAQSILTEHASLSRHVQKLNDGWSLGLSDRVPQGFHEKEFCLYLWMIPLVILST